MLCSNKETIDANQTFDLCHSCKDLTILTGYELQMQTLTQKNYLTNQVDMAAMVRKVDELRRREKNILWVISKTEFANQV